MVKKDPPLRIALYQALIGVILSGILASFDWKMPKMHDLLFMLCMGVFFAFALFLFLDSFFYTESYIIGVLGYSLVFFVEMLNWIIYKEPIITSTIIGSLLICIGGALTIWNSYLTEKK
jgi:drug/metabolite transporter (DMT)-like permease